MKPLTECIKEYPKETAIIRYLDLKTHKIIDWAIVAHPKNDNEQSLRNHLKRHRPNTKFIEYILH